MATVLKLRSDIKKLKQALESKAIKDSIKVKLREQITKAEKELDALQKPKAAAKKATSKTSTTASQKPTLDRIQKLIKGAKYKIYQGKGVDLKKDAAQPAKTIGKRISKGLKSNQFGDKKSNKGNVYYEYRPNRLDVKQPPKRYPKLAKGGLMDRVKAIKDKYAMGGKLEVGNMVTVDDSGYVKLFTGFDISKPAKIISKGKTKRNGKVVYFYGLETADGRKPFNNAMESMLTKVSEDGGYMAKGGEISKDDIVILGVPRSKITEWDWKSILGMAKSIGGGTFILKDEKGRDIVPQVEFEWYVKEKMADGGMMAKGGTIEEHLEKINIYNDLDAYEYDQYKKFTDNGMSKVDALKVIINNVEGDTSQLSKKLASVSKKMKYEDGGYMEGGGKNAYKSDKEKLANLAYQLQAADEGWIKNNHSEFIKMQNEYKAQWEKVYGNTNYANPDDFANGGYMAGGGNLPIENSSLVGKSVTIKLPNEVNVIKDIVVLEYENDLVGKKGIWSKKYVVNKKEDGGLFDGGSVLSKTHRAGV